MLSPTHTISLRHRAGPLDLDLAFTINVGWTALYAPSGAGKTTILRMIAGLMRPDTGRITHEDRVLLDTASGIIVPAHRRDVRMVAQRPALFPHLSVAQNVGYGVGKGPPNPARRERIVAQMLELCRANHLYDKNPSELSGGERQRVAVARTLAAGGAGLLLLDEPFTGLEASLREDILGDLCIWTAERNLPVLLVTHDLGEVFAAQAHVLKMQSGRIIAQGPVVEVLAKERDRLIARLT